MSGLIYLQRKNQPLKVRRPGSQARFAGRIRRPGSQVGFAGRVRRPGRTLLGCRNVSSSFNFGFLLSEQNQPFRLLEIWPCARATPTQANQIDGSSKTVREGQARSTHTCNCSHALVYMQACAHLYTWANLCMCDGWMDEESCWAGLLQLPTPPQTHPRESLLPVSPFGNPAELVHGAQADEMSEGELVVQHFRMKIWYVCGCGRGQEPLQHEFAFVCPSVSHMCVHAVRKGLQI